VILGRFTPERKAVLDGIREALRHRGYVPMLFEFEKSDNRDLTETIKILAGLARFVIADLSDPNSIPHELMSLPKAALCACSRDFLLDQRASQALSDV